MNSRLNYSTLEDAWGLPESENSKSDITSVQLDKKFKYRKPQENKLSIDKFKIKMKNLLPSNNLQQMLIQNYNNDKSNQ